MKATTCFLIIGSKTLIMVEVSDIGLQLDGEVLVPDLKIGVMAALLSDEGIKP